MTPDQMVTTAFLLMIAFGVTTMAYRIGRSDERKLWESGDRDKAVAKALHAWAQAKSDYIQQRGYDGRN